MCTCVGMRFSLGNRSHNGNQNFAIIYVYDIVNTCMYACICMAYNGILISWSTQLLLMRSGRDAVHVCLAVMVLLIQAANWRVHLALCSDVMQTYLPIVYECHYGAYLCSNMM